MTDTFPKDKGLSDIDAIQDQMMDFVCKIDKEENKLIGGVIFPYDDLNHLSAKEFGEFALYDTPTIQEMIYRLDEVVRRIEIQENRVQQVLDWINGKLYKAVARVPEGLLNFKETEVKYYTLAKHYPVVKWLMDEREDYASQAIHWRNLAKNTEKKTRSLWFLIEHRKGE